MSHRFRSPLGIAVLAGLALGSTSSLQAQTARGAPAAVDPAAASGAPRRFETVHEGVFGSTRLRYRASVSEFLLHDLAGAPAASVFVTSYVRTDVRSGANRPVIFTFNGGPGSSSIWLHLGFVGPIRVDQDEPAAPQTVAPFRVVANSDSPLDAADIVLIDPPGTGFSTLVGGGKAEQFYGVKQDAQATVEVIRQWLRRNGRENSPKFLLSESYGTVRAATVAKLLAGGPFETGNMEGITLNGVILAGQSMDMARSPDDDRNYLNILPTLAATACYFRKVPVGCTPQGQVTAARKFVTDSYLSALHAGSALPLVDQRRTAEQLSQLIGLSPEVIKANNLRISGSVFAAALLADQGKRLGTYDGRYTLPFTMNGSDPVADDPAMGQYVPAFVAAYADYARRVLGVTLDQPYQAIGFRAVNARWDYGFGPGVPVGRNFAVDLAAAMTRNPQMRLLVATGYYDLVTPLESAQYTIAHAGIPLSATTFRYYESGHMPYLGAAPRKAFAADIRAFVGAN